MKSIFLVQKSKKKSETNNDFWNDGLKENITYNKIPINQKISKIKNIKISSINDNSTKGKRKRNKKL